jgi:hypothetical protein
MNLEARLRAFAAFARRRSLSAAALELRISQPAASKHVADVEKEVGVQLVERRPRGGELTPAGEFLANALVRLGGWRVRRTISIIRLRDATATPSAREFLTMLHAGWGRLSPGWARRLPNNASPRPRQPVPP